MECDHVRIKLPDFPIFIAGAVLVALVGAVVLMAAFGFADRIIFFLQLAFALSATSALWCVFSKRSATEYAVWTMYLTGLALMVEMVRRFLPKKQDSSDHKDPVSDKDRAVK